MSFCRITGRARNLPKPNFFPIIPPISPADARKLCRITGKRMDDHNYVPLLEFGKRPECVRCLITAKNANKENKKCNAKEDGKTSSVFGPHEARNDFMYVCPVLEREAIEKSDLKAFDDLMRVLKKMEADLSGEDANKSYVYSLPSMLCGLILPAGVEEAIRKGEIESVSVSKSCDKAIFKIKGRPTLFVPLNEVDLCQASKKGKLYDGRGQNKETLTRQKQALEAKKRKTLTNKKIFEDLEKQADEEMMKDLERPAGKARVAGGKKSKQAQQYRQKIAKFKERFFAEGNMAKMGNWADAMRLDLSDWPWEKIGQVKQLEISAHLPKKARLSKFEAEKFARRKRIKNVYVPDQPGLEVVPLVEDLDIQRCEIPAELVQLIRESRQSGQTISSSLKSMFACEESLKSLPTLQEFEEISKKLADPSCLTPGCMYDHGDGAKFCPDPSSAPQGANVILGFIVNTKSTGPMFVPGERVKLKDGSEVLIPGQRMTSGDGEFIPGASIRGDNGQFQFIPGVVDSGGQLRAGQFLHTEEGQIEFVKGQIVHTPKGAKFVEGETISTAAGIKFVAG